MVSGKCFPSFFVFICQHLWQITSRDFAKLISSKIATILSLPMDRMEHNSSAVMQCLLHIISVSPQCKGNHTTDYHEVLLFLFQLIPSLKMSTVDIHSCFIVYAEQTFVNTLWLFTFSRQELKTCFKCPSISVIFKSTVYLPQVKLNGCDYQTMMRVQGPQLCSKR
jgi:hypothetical protein